MGQKQKTKKKKGRGEKWGKVGKSGEKIQSSAGPAFVVWDRDRDSAISGLVNGMGPGLRKTWSRRRDGIGTVIILVPKSGRDWD